MENIMFLAKEIMLSPKYEAVKLLNALAPEKKEAVISQMFRYHHFSTIVLQNIENSEKA